MISCFALEMSRTMSSERPLEDLVLERVELVADLAQHREAVVEAVVDDPVEQVAGAAREQLLAQLLLLAAALEQVLDRLQRRFGIVTRKSRPTKMSSSPALSRPTCAVEDREVQDDEQVVVVLVDLRPLVAREHVLEVEGVEVEVLLEPGGLERRRALDVDPAQAGALDGLDLGAGARGAQPARRDRRRAGGAAWASEGSASVLVSLVGSVIARLGQGYATGRGDRARRSRSAGIVARHIPTASRGVEGLAR